MTWPSPAGTSPAGGLPARRRLRPWLWLAAPAAAAAVLVAWTLAEGRRERAAVEEALRSQARLLAQALGPALASASAAARELEELLTWKLLDNARLAAELEAAGGLSRERRRALVESNGLAAAARFAPDGGLAWSEGLAEAPDLVREGAESLRRGEGEIWVSDRLGSAEEPLLAAGVRTADGGALLALADPRHALAFGRRIGVDSALQGLVASPAVLYLAYREEPSGLAGAASWDGGPVPPEPPEGELRGRPCFEVEVPVTAPAGRAARLRVGLDGAPLSRAASSALRRTTLAAAVLAVVGLVSLSAALAEVARAREREALQRRLAASERERQQGERLAAAGALAAGLAHEVRNPLNAIGLAAQRIDRLGGLEAAQRSLVERIRTEAARLEGTLKGFLDLARPADGPRSPTDLAALARDVLAALELEARSRSVALEGRLDPARAPVEADAVRRALFNLVRNAIEASPPGSAVEVATGSLPDGDGGARALLAVRDRGPGVPPELERRAFEAFVTTKAEGTGLGLAWVARVAADHGGRASLRPRAGGGAEAVLELPAGEEGAA